MSQGTIAGSPGQFDRISLTQQIRLDLARGKKEFSYTLIRKGKLKQYHYRVVGREIVSTSTVDPLTPVMIERQGKNSSKNTKFGLPQIGTLSF